MAPPRLAAPLRSPRIAAALISLLCALGWAGVLAGSAQASHTQVSMIQDDAQLLQDPAGTLMRFRQLGAQQVRLPVRWNTVAPDPTSFKAPRHFRAGNPADYPAAGWAPYDAIVRDAATDGIQVNLNVVGDAPLWATGRGMPSRKNTGWPFGQWEPSAPDLGSFVHALGIRYSGNYNPQTNRLQPHNKDDLPRVSFWSIWNEPDYGPSLAPQALPGHPGVPYSPRMYRGLVDHSWSALQQTGHGHDTFLIGELAPRATNIPFGVFNGMLPTTFVQSLYCLNSKYQQLRGWTAWFQGCPTSASGSRRFVAQNPGLFKTSGFSDHVYMRWFPPNTEENFTGTGHPVPYPNSVWSSLVHGFVSLGTIGNLTSALGRALGAYRWHRKVPIWNTEFGYITNPPKKRWSKDATPWVSPGTAAYYDNWAEYLSWKNPQIASFEQYLLYDGEPALASNDYGGYASGLLYFNGRQKPSYGAWRLPLYMPQQTASSSHQKLEVWGDVRPADFAARDFPYGRVVAQLLFKAAGGGPYTLLQRVTVAPPDGYFDIHLAFPQSGTLLMRWFYPVDPAFGAASGQPVFSRGIRVTVQ